MNGVTFDLVGPPAIVFQTRSLKTVSVAFNCFLLVLAVCPFTQFTSIVFEIFVDAVQFPAQKELLPFLDFRELRGQFDVDRATDPVREGRRIQRGPVQLDLLERTHLPESRNAPPPRPRKSKWARTASRASRRRSRTAHAKVFPPRRSAVPLR